MSEHATYYDRPVVKEPVWRPSIALYLFTGGLAGASAGLGLLARLRGDDRLARRCTLAAAAAAAVSPVLLIEDLGRPARFHHMLRVFKITSPMSVGTWVLSAFGVASGVAAASEVTGIARPVGRAAEVAAGAFGMPLATYTAALLSDTAIPAWHGARKLLPFLFAAGSAASAGALGAITTPGPQDGMARRLAIGGAIGEIALAQAVERASGEAGEAYGQGAPGRLAKLAVPLLAGGATAMLAGRRSRAATTLGAAAVLSGTILERFAVWRAGTESARRTVS